MFRFTLPATIVLLLLLTLSGCARKAVAPAPVEPAPAVQAPVEAPAAVEVASQAVEAPQGTTLTTLGGNTLETVYFAYDAHTLDAAARQALERSGAWLQANPAVKVVIEGHCDERGSDEYNLALGERRALAVKNYLTGLGIAAERLNTISYGEERPAVPGSDEAAWAKNRRAEFK